MKYKYLIIDANNLGYRVLSRNLDRSLIKVSNKFVYKSLIKDYIDTVSYLKILYESEEVILLFDNHTSKDELKKAFQLHQGTTRKDLKETYKSNRKKETNEFYESLNFIKYFYMVGDKEYHTVQIFKLEADDLLAPCLKSIVKNDTALLVTNDSDWTRYLTDNIHYLPDQLTTPHDKHAFYTKYSFYPTEDKVILYKILFGDSADNISILFPEIKTELRYRILHEFDSIFDLILTASQKDYTKPYVSIIKDRETDLKINYQLLSSIEVSNEQFLSHYTTGRGSDKLKNAILDIILDRKEKNNSFAFGGIKVPRVNPK